MGAATRIVFVVTKALPWQKVCLPQQNLCPDKIFLLQQTRTKVWSRQKTRFVVTNTRLVAVKVSLSRQTCCGKSSLVATNMWWQRFWRHKHTFVATNMWWQRFWRHKHTFVATNMWWQRFWRHKHTFVATNMWWQRFWRHKHTFVATNMWWQRFWRHKHTFVATNMWWQRFLAPQAYFCRDEHDKNYTCGSSRQSYWRGDQRTKKPWEAKQWMIRGKCKIYLTWNHPWACFRGACRLRHAARVTALETALALFKVSVSRFVVVFYTFFY